MTHLIQIVVIALERLKRRRLTYTNVGSDDMIIRDFRTTVSYDHFRDPKFSHL